VKIYTKTGDRGETGLFGGARVKKSEPRVSAYGEVDELNAAIGVVRAGVEDPQLEAHLGRIQEELFCVGAELATPHGAKARSAVPPVEERWIAALEAAIDAWEEELPRLDRFVLPGGTRTAAALHLARCTCRRAERHVVALAAEAEVVPVVLVYLNRLSDFLFVAARVANHRAGRPEVLWNPGRKE
jgi:cob(I)alamin adenosyltransferase